MPDAPGTSGRRIGRAGLVLALAALSVAMGCGKRGRPVAPRPRGPLPATRVEARQLGDAAVVSFTVPPAPDAKEDEAPVRVELLRVAYAKDADKVLDAGTFSRRGQPVAALAGGPYRPGDRVRLQDGQLPPLAQTGGTLRYGVRLFDRKGRSSSIAAAEDLQPLPSVPSPTDLRAESVPAGVQLSWTATADSNRLGHAIYRADAGADWPESPLNASPVTTGEFLDQAVTRNAAYRYEVRPVLAAGSPRREGLGTRVEIVAVDRFPPGAPEAVVAVQEGPAVRLFWRPSSEDDVVGYRVWRRAADGTWVDRSGIVERALWLDSEVAAGESYAYRITAVDSASPANESGPSTEVEVEIGEEPSSPEGTR